VVGRVADEDLVRDRREPPRDRGVLLHDVDGQPATLERGGGGTSHPSAADHQGRVEVDVVDDEIGVELGHLDGRSHDHGDALVVEHRVRRRQPEPAAIPDADHVDAEVLPQGVCRGRCGRRAA
jgi:hypothetical protein